MKALTRDEKKYINQKLSEKVDELLKLNEFVGTDVLLRETVLDMPVVKETIEYLQKVFPKEDILNHIYIRRMYSKQACFSYNLSNGDVYYNLTVNVNLDDETLESLNVRDTLQNINRDLSCSTGILNIEEYYILFTTWKAPSTERLNKINELIEIIYKNLILSKIKD